MVYFQNKNPHQILRALPLLCWVYDYINFVDPRFVDVYHNTGIGFVTRGGMGDNTMVPMLELFEANVGQSYSAFKIQYIDCEKYHRLCVRKFNVTSYPHFRLIVGGKNVDVVPWMELAKQN